MRFFNIENPLITNTDHFSDMCTLTQSLLQMLLTSSHQAANIIVTAIVHVKDSSGG